MTTMMVLRTMAGLETARWCRVCGESIARRDRFGLSESVCVPCRRPHGGGVAARAA